MSRLNFSYPRDPVFRDKVYRYLFQLFIVFYVALYQYGTNATLLLIVIFWLTEPSLWSGIKRAFRNPIVLSLLSLFFMHLIGMLYTENLHEGVNKLEARSVLAIFPIVLATIRLSDKTFTVILKTFVAVCFLIGLAGLINSTRLYSATGEAVYLYSDNLLLLLDNGQAIYFALYLNVAILFILHLLINGKCLKWERYACYFLVLPFFLLLIFLLASRISLMLIVCMAIGGAAYYVVREKKWFLGAGILAGMLVAGIALGDLFPKTINRFKSLTEFHFDYSDDREVYHFNEEDFANRWNGFTIRLAIWSCTWEAIEAHPILGAGTGDYMTELRKVYKERDFRLGLRHDYSPANQFLQIWLTLGIVGLVVFLISLSYPARKALQRKDYLYLIFLAMVVLSMFTEEILIVYRGVLFFSFFNSLLVFRFR